MRPLTGGGAMVPNRGTPLFKTIRLCPLSPIPEVA
jgi:hypothetical protein